MWIIALLIAWILLVFTKASPIWIGFFFGLALVFALWKGLKK